MKKTTNVIAGCLVVLAAIGAAVITIRDYAVKNAERAKNGMGTMSARSGDLGMSETMPDTLSISLDSDEGDKTVTNKADGYSFTMPSNWYLEPDAGDGVTVYPDYDPAGGAPASCKIEISKIPADGSGVAMAAGLSAWIIAHLHADPTANVSESVRTNITTGDGHFGIEWQGTLNGAPTALDYVPTPDGKNVLEFAPSEIMANNGDGDDCTIEVQAVLANIKL